MPPTHLVETLFDRPIAFHRVFAELTDSITAGLMLSQAVYWSKRTKDSDGWFYKKQFEWFDETYLTRREQDTARATLRKQRRTDAAGKLLPPFWYEERRGLPAKIFYRVDFDVLLLHLQAMHRDNAQKRQTKITVEPDLTGVPTKGNAQKRQTRLAENATLDGTKAPNQRVRKRQSGSHESANHSLQRLHAETTGSRSRRARAPEAAAAAAQSKFTEIEIAEFLVATKPHNAARNGGLAHKLWLTGEDDHLIAHWQQKQQPQAPAASEPVELPTYTDFWRGRLAEIKAQVNDPTYATWFAPLNAVAVNGHVLIAAPDQVFAQWLEDNYASVLDAAGLQQREWQFPA